MSQEIESIYEEYLSKLKQAMPNVDPNLTHRVLYLEKKLSGEDMTYPDVSAMVEYKAGIGLDQKISDLRSRHSVEVEHADKKDTLHIMGRMKIAKLKAISSDADIVKITGKVDSGYGE